MSAIACRIITAVLFIALAGCGGGDDSSSTARGEFTLSATTASFGAKRFGPPPAVVVLQMQLTGSGTAAVGAAYRDGVSPASWLDVDITGSGNTYSVALIVNTTLLAIGSYDTTISVGTADASGNVLQHKDIQVSYKLRDGVSIVGPPVEIAATLGHSKTSFDEVVSIATEGREWSVSSDVPWISTPAGTRQGTGTAALTIDTSALGAGMSTATVRVTNTADSTDYATLPVSVTVDTPDITADPGGTLQFGGTIGLVMEERTAHLTLFTGSRAHPWTAAFTSPTGAGWLEIDNSSGTVGNAGIDLVLTPNAANLSAGSYTGNIAFTANVDGTLVTKTLPVSLNVDAQHLWTSANGVGLSSFPGRQTLTRTLRVFNSLDRTDLTLQASSNQNWLQVSVPDGETVVLTAVPGALAMDQLHTATVTISASDSLIMNQEIVRVALWRGSVDPTDQTIVSSALYLAAHPLEPLVFANDVQGTIEVFNVYTGAVVRTLPAGAPGPMTLSSDGSVLYIGDSITKRLIAVDPQTGATLQSYQTSMDPLANTELTLAYARPDAHAILVSGATGEAFDAQSGAKLNAVISGRGQVTAGKDGRRIYVQTAGLSPAPIALTDVRYSTLNSMGLVATHSLEWSGHFDNVYMPSNGLDIALTENGEHLFRANGSPYGFGVVDPSTLVGSVFLAAVAYPAAVECGWRGYCFGSAGPNGNTGQDVWIYDANQQYVSGFVLGSQNLYARGLVLSADDTRLIAGLTVQPNDSRRLKILSTPQ